MPHPHLVVIVVMGWGHLHCSCTKAHIHKIVSNDGKSVVTEWMQTVLPYEVLVTTPTWWGKRGVEELNGEEKIKISNGTRSPHPPPRPPDHLVSLFRRMDHNSHISKHGLHTSGCHNNVLICNREVGTALKH